MSVLADVLSSLRTMTQLQLLLAFLACTGYALGQGGLIGPRGRRIAWAVTLLSALGFAIESTEWMHAAMLATFAVAGLGLFVASAWIISRLLGFTPSGRSGPTLESEFPPTNAQPSPSPRAMAAPHNGPAHSV
ncbi:MAG: hypothetical protein ABI887_11065 [Burkholderiales bacterium]